MSLTADEFAELSKRSNAVVALMMKAEPLLKAGQNAEEVRKTLIAEGNPPDIVTEALLAVTDPFTGTVQHSPDVEGIRAKLWKITQTPKLSATEFHRMISAAVIEWLHERGRFYFHSERPDFAGVMYFDSNRKLLLPVQGDAFLAWLADCLAINRAERSFAFVSKACETEGLSARSTGILPATYWAATASAFYLSNGPGSMAKITAKGVEIVDNGTDEILFPYGATLAPWELTAPTNPFDVCSLFRDMSTSARHGRDLFQLWVCCLPSDQKTSRRLFCRVK